MPIFYKFFFWKVALGVAEGLIGLVEMFQPSTLINLLALIIVSATLQYTIWRATLSGSVSGV